MQADTQTKVATKVTPDSPAPNGKPWKSLRLAMRAFFKAAGQTRSPAINETAKGMRRRWRRSGRISARQQKKVIKAARRALREAL